MATQVHPGAVARPRASGNGPNDCAVWRGADAAPPLTKGPRRGVPGVLVTDVVSLRNPNYHQPTDLIDTLDLDLLAAITRAGLASVCLEAGIVP